jgi:hypothetical protein
MFVDSLGFYQTSTAVVYDFDDDGVEDALLSINVHSYDNFNRRTLLSMLVIINFVTNEVIQIGESETGSNISTTPWIGDLDKDGMLDIVYFHATNPNKSYTFDGMKVNRVETKIPYKSDVRWGAYMGSHYNGIFNGK